MSTFKWVLEIHIGELRDGVSAAFPKEWNVLRLGPFVLLWKMDEAKP